MTDFEFSGFEDIFYGYNMGESPKRTRKVTITEITEDNDDWAFIDEETEVISCDSDSDDEEDAMTTDEVYQLLDDLVQDWKIKLEFIVGDGLKKLRKLTKEKRLMTKYLPGVELSRKGQGKINEARNAILKQWKNDFCKIINSTTNKLEKLTKEKLRENEDLYTNKLMTQKKKMELINAGKKTYINIDCNTGN